MSFFTFQALHTADNQLPSTWRSNSDVSLKRKVGFFQVLRSTILLLDDRSIFLKAEDDIDSKIENLKQILLRKKAKLIGTS